MSRLYDRIMRDRRGLFNFTEYDMASLNEAEIIIVDNVRGISESIGGDDLINIAPPFRTCFVEHKIRKAELMPVGGYFGVLMMVLDKDEIDGKRDVLPTFTSDIEWAVLSYQIIQARTIRNGMPIVWCYTAHGISIDGSLVKSYAKGTTEGEGGDYVINLPKGGIYEGILQMPDVTLELAATITSEFYVSLMGINLMHCKNVELIEETPPPKLSKSHEKKYGNPLISYKLLKVHSMRKEREGAEPDENRKGLARLHIARGHFKDFRNGSGLFGKYQDIYWWDQQVRGNPKRGAVIKDYDVQVPNDQKD